MAHSLRILVVLPMYGGSLPLGRYCARALRDMGHAVTHEKEWQRVAATLDAWFDQVVE